MLLSPAAFKAFVTVVEFGIEVYEADKDAQPLINLAKQVQHDLRHARNCRKDVWRTLSQHEHQRTWVVGTIMQATTALSEFDKYLLQGAKDQGKSRIHKRLIYLLWDSKKIADLEKGLKFSHTSLQTVISLLHQFSFQDDHRSEGAGGHGIRRASSQRPRQADADADHQAPLLSENLDVSSVKDTSAPGTKTPPF